MTTIVESASTLFVAVSASLLVAITIVGHFLVKVPTKLHWSLSFSAFCFYYLKKELHTGFHGKKS